MLKLLLPALCCTVAEQLLNPLIALDPDSKARLQRLQGKQLAFRLRGFGWRLVITAQQNGLWLNSHDEAVDCAIEVDASALKQLTDPSQLTRLIREDKLQITGDLPTLQQFSAFFQQLNPDWQEKLSLYTGDAIAHKTGLVFRQLQQGLAHHWQQQQQNLQELLQDELRVSPVAAELQQFSREVSALSGRTELLQRQLTQLLAQQQAHL